jgi:hypothetical protein
VKCSTSRYRPRELSRPELSTRVTRVLVTVTAPPPDRPAARPRARRKPGNHPAGPRHPQPGTRRDQVTRLMASQPGRDWTGSDLARALGIKPANLLTQLGEWASWGFLAKTGRGRYTLPQPSAQATAPGKPAPPAKPLPVDTQPLRLTTRHCSREAPTFDLENGLDLRFLARFSLYRLAGGDGLTRSRRCRRHRARAEITRWLTPQHTGHQVRKTHELFYAAS